MLSCARYGALPPQARSPQLPPLTSGRSSASNGDRTRGTKIDLGLQRKRSPGDSESPSRGRCGQVKMSFKASAVPNGLGELGLRGLRRFRPAGPCSVLDSSHEIIQTMASAGEPEFAGAPSDVPDECVAFPIAPRFWRYTLDMTKALESSNDYQLQQLLSSAGANSAVTEAMRVFQQPRLWCRCWWPSALLSPSQPPRTASNAELGGNSHGDSVERSQPRRATRYGWHTAAASQRPSIDHEAKRRCLRY